MSTAFCTKRTKSVGKPSAGKTGCCDPFRLRYRPLRIESLEIRSLLSITPTLTVDGLHFAGDAANDTLYLQAGAANLLEYSTDGIRYTSDLGGGSQVNLSLAGGIFVNLGGGNNLLAVDASLAAALGAGGGTLTHTGEGDDTLLGPQLASTWNITAANAGTLGSNISFTNVKNLQGAAGNQDTFVFAFGASLGGIADGGAGGFDSLVFEGIYNTVVLDASGPSSGSVEYDSMAVQYTGLEPISVSGANITVNGSPNNDSITVQPDPGNPGFIQVLSPATMETVTFPVPAISLTVNGANGNDTVTLSGNLVLPGVDLTISGETLLAGAGTTVDTTILIGTDGDVTLAAANTANLPSATICSALVDINGAVIHAGNLTMTANATMTGAAAQVAKVPGGKIADASAAGSSNVLVHGGSSITASGNATLNAVSLLQVSATTTSDSGGSAGIDAAIAFAQANGTAIASVGGSASLVVAGSLLIAADNTIGVTLTADGTTGGSTAAGGTVSLAIVNGTTNAIIGGSASVQAASIDISATSSNTLAATAKATPKGSTSNDANTQTELNNYDASSSEGDIPVAAAVAINDLTSENLASIAPTSNVTATTGGVNITGTAANVVSATADGSSTENPVGVGVAVSINVADLSNQASIGGTVAGNGIDLEAVQPVNGSDSFQAKATSGASDATQVGVAGSLALNVIDISTQALLQPTAVVNAGTGTVILNAEETSTTETKADAKVSGDPAKAGIGASVAIDKENNVVLAEIQNAAQLTGGTDLTIVATADHTADTEGKGGATGGTAFDASVALNFLDNETTARLGSGSSITLSGTVLLDAAATGNATAKADGTTEGGNAAVGAAVAINVVSDNALAQAARDFAAGGTVSVMATTNSTSTADAKASVKGAAGDDTKKTDDQTNQELATGSSETAPSAATSDGKVGVAAAIGLNIVTGQAEAEIAAGVTVTSGGLVSVISTNETDATATADGSAALGAAGNVGIAVAINKAQVINRATIGGTVNSGGLAVKAVQPAAASHDFTARATSGASDATKVGVAGSFAMNSLANTTQALLQATAVINVGTTDDMLLVAENSVNDTAHAKAAVSGQNTVGVGAAVALSLVQTNLTHAEVQDAAVIGGGHDLSITANANHAATTTAEAGVAGGVAISPVVAIALIQNDTTARLGTAPGGPLSLSGDVTIEATHSGTSATTAGATAAGSNVAVGAAVSVAVTNDTTTANLARDLIALGFVLVYANSTTPTTTEAKASVKGNKSDAKNADDEADDQVNDNPNTTGQVLPSSGSQVANANTTATSNSGTGTSGVGIAAAIAVSKATTGNTASISPSVHVTAGDTVAVRAVNETDVTTKATGIGDAGNDSALIGAAVAIGGATVTNQAIVGAGAVVAGQGVTIEAISPAQKFNDFITWGLGAAKGQDQFGLAGSVAVNVVTVNCQAFAGAGATINSVGSIAIRAASPIALQTVAAAGAYGSGVGIGAAVAYNNVNNTAEAFLGTGAFADATESISITADTSLVPLTVTIPKIGGGPQVTAVALAGSISTGKAGIGGSVVVETFTINTRAFLGQGSHVNDTALAGTNQSVTVAATDSTKINTGAGGLGGSTGVVGIGMGVDVEVVNKDTRAYVGPSAIVHAAGDVAVLASSTNSIQVITASAGVALGGVAVGGAVAVCSLDPAANMGTRAYIEGGAGTGSTVHAGGDITVSAAENPNPANKVLIIAGGLAYGSTAGIGASVTLLKDNGTVQAYIGREDDIQAGGAKGISVTAKRNADLKTFSVGGAGAGSASVAGAVSRNQITNTVDAHISAGATVAASAPIAVSAAETTSIQALAGGVAGAGGVGVGAAVSRNDISGTTTAYIDGATVTSATGDVAVGASSNATIKSYSVGGAGAGSFSAGGSLSANNISNTISAYLSGGANVTANRSVSVSATSTPILQVLAGGIAGAAGAAVGAAIATNNIHGLTTASIYNATAASTTGAVQVTASWSAIIQSLTVGGAGAAAFAAGGSVSTNFIHNTIDAHVSNGANVTAAGSILVSAASQSSMESLAGGVAGAGGAAVGAALATNDLGASVNAYVSGGTTTLHSTGGGIQISSSMGGSIKSLTVGGAGAAGFAGGGSVSNNYLTSIIDARVYPGVSLTAAGAISITATIAPPNCDTQILALAGGVAGAAGAAIGAALGTNSVANIVMARVEGANLQSVSGTISVAASAASSIKALSVGGAGAGAFALGGSVSLNSITDSVNAHISSGAVVGTMGVIQVTATNNPTIESLAGGVAGAGAAAIGASVATNDLAGVTTSYVEGATLNSWNNRIDIGASSLSTIKTLSVGGAGAGAFAAGGSVSRNTLRNVVNARVTSNAGLSAVGSIDVTATDIPKIDSLAGGVAGAGAAAIGAGVATNDIANTVTAYIDQSTIFAQAIPRVSPGYVNVTATSTPTVKTIALGGAGAAFFAAGGSVVTLTLANTVDAHIANSSDVRAGTSITVTAQSMPSIDLEAGAISGAIVAAGAGIATATIGGQTNAYVTSNSVLSAASGITIDAHSDIRSALVNAYIGGGGIVALDAAKATLNSSNNASAYIAGSAVINRAGSVLVTARTTSPLDVKGFGATLGLGSVGRVVSRATENGLTQAYVDGGVKIGDAADPNKVVGALTVSANGIETVNAKTWAGAAGIAAGTFNEATASVVPVVKAYIYGNNNIFVAGNVQVAADSEGSAASKVFSLSVGGLAAGMSSSNATENPEVDAYVGAGANVSAINVTVQASHNVSSGTGANAEAESPSIALVGYGGAVPTATASPNVNAYLSYGGTLQAFGNIAVISISNSAAVANALAVFGGLLGKGTSTPTATASGTIRTHVDGTVAGGNLSVTTQTSNTADTDGTAVSGGLVAGLGASANTTVAPVIQTYIGNDSQSANVAMYGNVNVTALATDEAAARAFGVAGGLVGIGNTRATATLTPRVDTYIGRYSNVSSTQGSISLLSRHNTQANGLPTGNGAHATTVAASGGIVSTENSTATATANATVLTHANVAAAINARYNVDMAAISDNSADATANGASGGIVALGGVRSTATASGTTQSFVSGVNALQTGGNLNVFAKGTNGVSAYSFAASGGVVSVPGSNASAYAVPQLLAAVSGAAPISVAGTADIKAVALGDSTANALGYGGGLVQAGTSRSYASWQPNVEANIGFGTVLTAGGDINLQAMNNFDEYGNMQSGRRARADATATGGGLVSIEGAHADINTSSTVNAHINPMARLTAANNLNVISRSRNNLQGTADGRSGGLVGKGAVNLNGQMSSQTLAQTDDAYSWGHTQIAAGKIITFAAYADNTANVNVTGGAGGLIGVGSGKANVTLNNPLVRARLGNYTETPCGQPYCGATLQIIAQNVADLRADSYRSVIAGIANNLSEATAGIYGGQTLSEIGIGCEIRVKELLMYAHDKSIYVSANAVAVVPFDLAGTNTANSQADEYTNAQVHIYPSAIICASQKVTLIAKTEFAETYSHAKTDTTGLTGNLHSNAGSNKFVNATVVTDGGAQIKTSVLNVSASAPHSDPNGYIKWPETHANTVVSTVLSWVETVCEWIVNILCLGGWLCDPEEVCHTVNHYISTVLGADVTTTTPGSESVTNSVHMNANVTIAPVSCCCDQSIAKPHLLIDATGKVIQMDGITATDGVAPLVVGQTVTTDRIVVGEIINPFSGHISIRAPSGSIFGYSNIDYEPTLDVAIANESTKNLYLSKVATYNTADPPTITYEASEGQTGWSYNLQTTLDPRIDISATNPLGGSVILGGDVLNPRGITTIHTAGGSILSEGNGGDIIAQGVDLAADHGTIGNTGQRISLKFPVNDLPPLGVLQAAGQQGVYLAVQTPAFTADPVVLDLGNIASANGDVDLLVRDATRQTESDCGCGEDHKIVPVASTVNLHDITAGGSISVTAGSSTTVPTDLAVQGRISAQNAVNLAATGLLTQIWTGAAMDGMWSNSGNWRGGMVPQAGARLLFPASFAGSISTNDLPAGMTFSSITVEADGLFIGGNAITLAPTDGKGLWIDSNDTLSLPITLAGDAVLEVSSASLTMLGMIDTAGHTLTVIGDSAAAVAFNSPITGSGRVVIGGNATVVFAAENSYSGGTRLGAGTLFVGQGGTTGSFLGEIVNNGILAFNRADNYTVSGNISGGGQVKHLGTGTPLLTGDNSYTGGTILSGSMAAGSNTALGTGNVTMLAGASLTLIPNGTAPINLALGSLAGEAGSNIHLGESALTVGGDNTSTEFAGAIDGFGGLVKSGSGNLTLSGISTFTGATTIAEGSITAATLAPSAGVLGSNLGNSTLPLVLGGTSTHGTLIFTGESASLSGIYVGHGGGAILSICCCQTLTVGGIGTAAHTNGNFTIGGDGNVTILGEVNLGSGKLTKADAGIFTLSGPGTMGGTTVSGGSLIAGPGSLGTGTVTVLQDAALTAFDLGGLAGEGKIDLAGRTLAVGGNGENTAFSGQFLDSVGGGTILKTGTGAIALSGDNTAYAGGMTIDQGAILFGYLGVLGGGEKIVVNGEGVAAAGYPLDQTFLNRISPASTGTVAMMVDSGNPLNFSAAGLAKVSLGAVGDVTYSGALTPFGNTYDLGGGDGTLVYAGPLSDGAGFPRAVNVVEGVVVLTGNNTYTGGTTVSGGQLTATTPNALGTGSITVLDGTLNAISIVCDTLTIGSAAGTVSDAAQSQVLSPQDPPVAYAPQFFAIAVETMTLNDSPAIASSAFDAAIMAEVTIQSANSHAAFAATADSVQSASVSPQMSIDGPDVLDALPSVRTNVSTTFETHVATLPHSAESLPILPLTLPVNQPISLPEISAAAKWPLLPIWQNSEVRFLQPSSQTAISSVLDAGRLLSARFEALFASGIVSPFHAREQLKDLGDGDRVASTPKTGNRLTPALTGSRNLRSLALQSLLEEMHDTDATENVDHELLAGKRFDEEQKLVEEAVDEIYADLVATMD